MMIFRPFFVGRLRQITNFNNFVLGIYILWFFFSSVSAIAKTNFLPTLIIVLEIYILWFFLSVSAIAKTFIYQL